MPSIDEVPQKFPPIETTRAFVRFRLPSGEVVELGHGDIIGRLVSATLHIDDPRVSEAHSLVSLRRGELVLLSLRRMFAVRGRPMSETVLRPGMAIELAQGYSIYVEDVIRPTAVLAIEVEGLGRKSLTGLASLHPGPPPHLSSRFERDAWLHIWWNGDGWRARTTSGAPQSVTVGDKLKVGNLEVSFVMMDLENGASTPSAADFEAPLRIIAWYDSVEIHRENRPPFTLGGVGARILSELIALEGPAEWQVIAREVWREDLDPHELRHRWDVSLARLRARLKHTGIRRDLLRSDGTGFIQVIRYPSDVFEDRT